MVRVLHVDDNPTDRDLARRELGRVFPDLRYHEARTQSEFDAALAAGDFDLVITDYQLKWSTGLVTLNAIKARYPERPVVMFTGSGNEEVAVEAMKGGLDDYVVKSARHMIRLVTAVRSALDRADARRRAAEAERERGEWLRREQAARAEAERLVAELREADRRKDEFLAMLAHELRNPLAPITNAVHLIRQPALAGPERQRVHDILERQTRHLGRIVDDLLDVTRITRGKIELRREGVDLAELVRHAVDDHRGAFQAAGLDVAPDIWAEPVWVRVDRTRLTQVVGNLLNNAVKFTDPGGAVAVRLAVDRATQEAVLAVEDTGIGIDAELLPRVFDMFTQADQPLDRSRGGLGLGLALVKGLIELHGGRAAAESAGPGRGARFTLRLPLDASEKSTPSATGPDRPAGSLRVLVVEDSRDGAESLRMLLELDGHEVRIAHTGSAGVEAAHTFRPTLILCDLGLPGGVSGYDVARSLRKDPATAAARLIAVSGYGQPEDQAHAREAGFDHHLTKPVEPDALRAVIAAAGQHG